MKELKEIAHRITQCDEVRVEGEKKLSAKAVFVNSYMNRAMFYLVLQAVFAKWAPAAVAKLSG